MHAMCMLLVRERPSIIITDTNKVDVSLRYIHSMPQTLFLNTHGVCYEAGPCYLLEGRQRFEKERFVVALSLRITNAQQVYHGSHGIALRPLVNILTFRQFE
ncbi:hypothetical protein Q7P37_010692 [Cladosporium fusiforme]